MRDLPNRADFCQQIQHGRCYTLPCFAAPQYSLKRFALRLWQLNCRFAASSAPKLQYFPLTNASWKCFTDACELCSGDCIILGCHARIAPCSTHGTSDTCRPRLFCWMLTSDLESGGARCARGPYTHALRAWPALRAGEILLVELAIIVSS